VRCTRPATPPAALLGYAYALQERGLGCFDNFWTDTSPSLGNLITGVRSALSTLGIDEDCSSVERVQKVLKEGKHKLPLLVFAPPGTPVPGADDPEPLDPVNYPVFWLPQGPSSGLLLYHRPPPGLKGLLPMLHIDWKIGDLAAVKNPAYVGAITRIAKGGYYTLSGSHAFDGTRVVRGRQHLLPVPHTLFMTTALLDQ